MRLYFLDTSALVKRNVREAGTLWVRDLTRAGSPDDLYIARIAVVEFVAAITRRERGGHLSRPQGAAIMGHFRRRVDRHYIVVEHSSAMFDEGSSLARAHALRGYDAVQLAAAVTLNRSRNDLGLSSITFVSADSELNRAAASESLPVEDPNRHP